MYGRLRTMQTHRQQIIGINPNQFADSNPLLPQG
jgi:hypothetical protein